MEYKVRSLANCAKIKCYIMSGRLPIIRSRDTARLTLSVYPRYLFSLSPYATTLCGFFIMGNSTDILLLAEALKFEQYLAASSIMGEYLYLCLLALAVYNF